MSSARLAITAGEPAGIGPELIAMLAQHPSPAERVVIADPQLLRARARSLDLPLTLREYHAGSAPRPQPAGEITVLPVPLAADSVPGHLDPANAGYVLATLDRACDGCRDGDFAAMVTAPVHKGVINDAGHLFSGHTEYLAARLGVAQVVMMLASRHLRVALVTTHLPLRAVADQITPQRLERVLRIVADDLRRFGLETPRLAVLGLNPHAGEGGHLGHEEQEVIIPCLQRLRAEGYALQGPLPADTAFTPGVLEHCDVVVAMYHDQGLPVLKYQGFGTAVNVTLGLPIIRTSVDHGTALDLAGSGRAEVGSLRVAVDHALAMAAGQLPQGAPT